MNFKKLFVLDESTSVDSVCAGLSGSFQGAEHINLKYIKTQIYDAIVTGNIANYFHAESEVAVMDWIQSCGSNTFTLGEFAAFMNLPKKHVIRSFRHPDYCNVLNELCIYLKKIKINDERVQKSLTYLVKLFQVFGQTVEDEYALDDVAPLIKLITDWLSTCNSVMYPPYIAISGHTTGDRMLFADVKNRRRFELFLHGTNYKIVGIVAAILYPLLIGIKADVEIEYIHVNYHRTYDNLMTMAQSRYLKLNTLIMLGTQKKVLPPNVPDLTHLFDYTKEEIPLIVTSNFEDYALQVVAVKTTEPADPIYPIETENKESGITVASCEVAIAAINQNTQEVESCVEVELTNEENHLRQNAMGEPLREEKDEEDRKEDKFEFLTSNKINEWKTFFLRKNALDVEILDFVDVWYCKNHEGKWIFKLDLKPHVDVFKPDRFKKIAVVGGFEVPWFAAVYALYRGLQKVWIYHKRGSVRWKEISATVELPDHVEYIIVNYGDFYKKQTGIEYALDQNEKWFMDVNWKYQKNVFGLMHGEELKNEIKKVPTKVLVHKTPVNTTSYFDGEKMKTMFKPPKSDTYIWDDFTMDVWEHCVDEAKLNAKADKMEDVIFRSEAFVKNGKDGKICAVGNRRPPDKTMVLDLTFGEFINRVYDPRLSSLLCIYFMYRDMLHHRKIEYDRAFKTINDHLKKLISSKEIREDEFAYFSTDDWKAYLMIKDNPE